MDKIIIHGLQAKSIIGVHDWERKFPQEILVSVDIFTHAYRVASKDQISLGLDYEVLSSAIQELVNNSRRYTVEALAEDIANLCFEYSGVIKVIVNVQKPGVIAYVQSVGVEIVRAKKRKIELEP